MKNLHLPQLTISYTRQEEIRQLIREEPLETRQIESHGELIILPTLPEMLRIIVISSIEVTDFLIQMIYYDRDRGSVHQRNRLKNQTLNVS